MLLKRLKTLALRWQHVAVLVLYALPFALICVLGIVWLVQNNLILYFFILCLVISVAAYVIRRVATSPLAEKSKDQLTLHDIELDPNPEWSEREKTAFFKTCIFVHEATESLQPWPMLPSLALEVVQNVTVNMGGSKKKALDFSAPEALLLIEKTAARYRMHLRDKIPFADQIAMGTVYWLWKKRKHLSLAWKFGDGGRRLLRFASNPTAAMIMELEQLMTRGATRQLSEQMMLTLQTVFLEEVASVAIDLYSGRLKFSDAELENIILTCWK